MSSDPEPRPEFSRMLAPDRLGMAPVEEDIAADAEERAALAERFDLLAMERLTANLRLDPVPGKPLLRLSGRIAARVTQRCVVSLEPVHSDLEEAFSQLYTLDPAADGADGADVVVEAEAEEPPEPVGAGGIDLGEVVAQHLAIALNPYPRAPGAHMPPEGSGAAEEPSSASPFSVLKSLKPQP